MLYKQKNSVIKLLKRTTSMIGCRYNSDSKLPLWSAGWLHHRRHPIAIQRLCLTEVDYVEDDPLQQNTAKLHSPYTSCNS